MSYPIFKIDDKELNRVFSFQPLLKRYQFLIEFTSDAVIPSFSEGEHILSARMNDKNVDVIKHSVRNIRKQDKALIMDMTEETREAYRFAEELNNEDFE